MSDEQHPSLKVHKMSGGWQAEMDDTARDLLIGALTRAIALEVQEGRANGEWAGNYRALRNALTEAGTQK